MSSSASGKASTLCQVLSSAEEILLVTHYHPDPDALASAAGLAHLLSTTLDKRTIITVSGEIGRAENRAVVELLELDLVPIEEVLPNPKAAVVLVDTQSGRANNPLQADDVPAAIIDHHPDWGENDAVPFVDLRPGYGATATIVTQYFQDLEVFIPPSLATALFYGISSETQRLARETSAADIVAAQFLFPYVDKRLLGTIQAPAQPKAHFVMIAEAVRNTLLWDDVAITLVEELPYADAAGEIADLMIRLDSATWAVCVGCRGDDLIVSARTSEPGAEAGRLLASVFPAGSAGGHSMTAGGKSPLAGAAWMLAARDFVARLLRKLSRRGESVSALAPDPSPRICLLLDELPEALASEPPAQV